MIEGDSDTVIADSDAAVQRDSKCELAHAKRGRDYPSGDDVRDWDFGVYLGRHDGG